ncbi:CAP domain-containing protein [Metabacillus litoralis]|uniref:CAP domain-containing protein n=1 Tax=Metabacillus litoralis TaxID=152268 RepID=UPI00203CAB7B|nr:CAP domain-containing protein [Metabacillus litoralis]MCM3411603.1 CAP domain-containing protein [Metabacillus litoralis]
MKKKIILSVVAGAALLMANPIVDKADAASNTTQTNVYYYQSSNVDMERINALLQKYFSNVKIQQPTQQPETTTKEEPIKVEQQPTAEQPETQEPVAQKPTVEQPVTQEPVAQQPTAEQPVTQEPAAQQPTTQQPAQTEQTTEQASYQLSQYEQQVVDLTNQERAKQGLPALKVDLTLSKVAREKSLDMQKNNYFSHTSPTYGSPFDMMKKFGVTYRTAGENIAKGQRTPQEVVNAWMNSSGHRANILSTKFTHIGVGYVAEGNYWTQQFIGK